MVVGKIIQKKNNITDSENGVTVLSDSDTISNNKIKNSKNNGITITGANNNIKNDTVKNAIAIYLNTTSKNTRIDRTTMTGSFFIYGCPLDYGTTVFSNLIIDTKKLKITTTPAGTVTVINCTYI